MKFSSRLLLMMFFISVLALQYQNCSSYSENTLFKNDLNSTVDGVTSGKAWLSLDLNTIIVKAQEDHFQIGGTCYPGDSIDNNISYSLVESATGRQLSLSPSNGETIRNDARCENGKFYLVVYVAHPTNGRRAGVLNYALQAEMNLNMGSQTIKTPKALKEIVIY
jgi:hypothetical protein